MTDITVYDSSDGVDEGLYHRWLQAHPSGLVLNSRRRIDPGYMVLHKATCHSISQPTDRMGKDPFTGLGYIKICANQREPLLTWITEHGGSGFTKLCTRCAP